jgi:hypothetical protein
LEVVGSKNAICLQQRFVIAFPIRRMNGDNSTNPKRDRFQQRFANVITFSDRTGDRFPPT